MKEQSQTAPSMERSGMNQEILLKANAQLYGTLTIIGGVLDGYVDGMIENGVQPDANLGVAAGLATKVLNDVEKMFDEASKPGGKAVYPGEYTMANLEVAAKAKLEDLKTAEQKEAFERLAYVSAGISRARSSQAEPFFDWVEKIAPTLDLGVLTHEAAGFCHPFSTRQYCRLCDAS